MTDWTGQWNYGYDAMNRLTSAVAPVPVPGQPAGVSGTLAYGYDWVGNRIHPPSGANPMVYNAADQLTIWPGMHRYSYDMAGNLGFVKNAGNTVTMASYTYTYDGLLATASFGASRTLANTWDADSNRVRLNVAAGQYDFTYDVTAGIPAVIEEVNAGASSTTTAYYFREPNGSLICRAEGETAHYYHFDALGSTRLLTDDDGVITDKYAYDAYGALLSHDRLSGSVDQPYQYVGQLGYYTHYQEPDFGLLQLGVRFYDPEVGRFTSRDPVKDEFISDYAYADGRPAVSTDPRGKWPWSPSSRGLIWWCGCISCVRRAQHEAWEEALWYYKYMLDERIQPAPPFIWEAGDNGKDMRNAYAHCTAACVAMRNCGAECAGEYLTYWEMYSRDFPKYEESRMDLHNNSEGFKCAGASLVSCSSCCMQKLQDKRLYVIDKRHGRR